MIIKQKFRDGKNMPKSAMENYIQYMEAGSSSLLSDSSFTDEQGRENFVFNKLVETKNMTLDEVVDDYTNQPTLFSGEELSIDSLKDSLMNAEGNIWIPIISFKESEAVEAGLDSQVFLREKARRFIDLFSEASNVPKHNLNYIAVMHQLEPDKQKENKDSGAQPHLHFVIWEDEPTLEKGVIDKDVLMDLSEKTKNLFLKENLSVKEKLLISKEGDVSFARKISKSVSDVNEAMGASFFNEKTIVASDIRDKIKDLSVEINITEDSEEMTLEDSMRLVAQKEKLLSLTYAYKELKDVAKEIDFKATGDDIINIMLQSESIDHKVNSVVTAVINNDAELSKDNKDYVIRNISVDLIESIDKINEGGELSSDDVQEMIKVFEKMMKHSPLEKKQDELGLKANEKALKALSELNVDEISKDLSEEDKGKLIETVKLSKIIVSMNRDKFDVPEMISETAMVNAMIPESITSPFLAESVEGLKITLVEQNELLLELSDKLLDEYSDIKFIKESIEDFKESLVELSESKEFKTLKESFTSSDIQKKDELKEKHQSLDIPLKDLFLEVQPEFTTKEWSMIQLKWHSEEIIDKANDLNEMLGTSKESKIEDFRHFKFDKDYERGLFHKQSRARDQDVSDVIEKAKYLTLPEGPEKKLLAELMPEDTIVKLDELKTELKPETLVKMKDMIKDLEIKVEKTAPLLKIEKDSEMVRIELSEADKTKEIKSMPVYISPYIEKTETNKNIAIVADIDIKEVELIVKDIKEIKEVEVPEVGEKSIETVKDTPSVDNDIKKEDGLPESLTEVSEIKEKEVAESVKKQVTEQQSAALEQEEEDIEFELEEMRAYYREMIANLELEDELNREEMDRLYYMMVQLEVMLRMNPESVSQDMRQFALTNNIEIPSQEKINSIIEVVREEPKPLSNHQKDTFRSYFPDVSDSFVNPYEQIFNNYPELTEDAFQTLREESMGTVFGGSERNYNLHETSSWYENSSSNPMDVQSWEDIIEILPDLADVSGIEDWKMPPFPLESVEDINEYVEYITNPDSTTFDHYFEGYTPQEIEDLVSK